MSDYWDKDENKQQYVKDVEKSLTLAEAGWLRKDSVPYPRIICKTCKIIQFHPLTYCPKCGGKFDRLKLSGNELLEHYGDYKQGY